MTRDEWMKLSLKGTSGDMVHDILIDWELEVKTLNSELNICNYDEVKKLLESKTRLEAEVKRLRIGIQNVPCPWPESVWTMTDDEYVEAVPDEDLRTAISGYLMRKGWELCTYALLNPQGKEE